MRYRLLVVALGAFGFPTSAIDVDDLVHQPRVLMLGRAPYRIDVLTRPDGLEFAGAYIRQVLTAYDDVPIGVLSVEDLIASKRAAGRPRDLAGVAMLEAILGAPPSGADAAEPPATATAKSRPGPLGLRPG